MPDLKITEEATRNPITGAEYVRLATPGANWKATLAAILATVPLAIFNNQEDQTLTGGANVTSKSLGTISSGTLTIDCGARPAQHLTNNGAFTLAAPVNGGSCFVTVTNGASAGAITFSGFTVGTNVGDLLDTVVGHKFTIFIWKNDGAGVAGYTVYAHQ